MHTDESFNREILMLNHLRIRREREKYLFECSNHHIWIFRCINLITFMNKNLEMKRRREEIQRRSNKEQEEDERPAGCQRIEITSSY